MHPPLCPVFGTDKALPGVSASGHCAAYSAIVKNSIDHETPISNYNFYYIDTDFFSLRSTSTSYNRIAAQMSYAELSA
jgi:hypothetical protein